MAALLRLSRAIDWLNDQIGRRVRWLTLGLVLVQFAVVVLRYAFGTSFIVMQESVLYLHATVFMLGAAYTYLYDGHVRVDIFYGEASPKRRAVVELIGVLTAVIPFCLIALWVSLPFVQRSWAILEGPLFYGGIPAVFLLKTLIPLFAALILLQAVSVLLRAVLVLAGRLDDVFERRLRDVAA